MLKKEERRGVKERKGEGLILKGRTGVVSFLFLPFGVCSRVKEERRGSWVCKKEKMSTSWPFGRQPVPFLSFFFVCFMF